MRVEFERSGAGEPIVVLYWDRTSELSRDPVTGVQDFEGYRVYRSNPGDDRTGNILDQSSLIAQYDTPGNRTGFNNGFTDAALLKSEIRDIILAKNSGVNVDYISVVDKGNLSDKEVVDSNSVLALAVKVGQTRLIDNCFLGK